MASKHEKVLDNNSYQGNQMKSPMAQHVGTTRLSTILKSESFEGCQGCDTLEHSTAAGDSQLPAQVGRCWASVHSFHRH